MQSKHKLSDQQIKNLVITTIIGGGILSMPSNLAMSLDNHGWVSIIISGLLVVPFVLMTDKVFKMHPNKSFYEIGSEIFGDLIFNTFLLVGTLYAVIILAYTVRVFGEVVKAFLLETTPIKVIIITMLLATVYLARSKIQVLGRTATMIYPILIGVIIFIIAVGIPEADFTNVLPISTLDFKKLPGAVFASFFYYGGYEIIFLAYPVSENKENNLKYILRAIFIVIGVYVAVYIVALSQFGVEQLKRSIWPTIGIVANVDLPGYFLENLEGVILALWVVIVYTTIGPILYSSGRALQHVFKSKSHEIFILPLIPIIYAVSLIPDNIVELYEELGRISGYFGVATIIGLPSIMFIGAVIKRRVKG